MSQAGIASDSTSPAADIETLTGNTGGAVSPTGSPGNINILGTDGVLVSGNAGTHTLSISQTFTTKYVVGATNSNYTTITSAIAAAVADGASLTTPKTVYVQPGTYNENLTVPSGIIIVGYDADMYSNHFVSARRLVKYRQLS
jgi:pectin methylesterase-like acyl-CoA thioesterase